MQLNESNSMNIPTRAELVDGDSPDERYVISHFLGKTREQAYQMFRDKPTLYTEDVAYMSMTALAFYLPEALRLIENPESKDNDDFACGVLTSLSSVVRRSDLTEDVAGLSRRIARYVKSYLAKFGAFASADGGAYLRSTINEIETQLFQRNEQQ